MEIVPGLHARRLIGAHAVILEGDDGLTLVDAPAADATARIEAAVAAL